MYTCAMIATPLAKSLHQTANLGISTSLRKWLSRNKLQFNFHRSPRPTQTSAAPFKSLYRERTTMHGLDFRRCAVGALPIQL